MHHSIFFSALRASNNYLLTMSYIINTLEGGGDSETGGIIMDAADTGGFLEKLTLSNGYSLNNQRAQYSSEGNITMEVTKVSEKMESLQDIKRAVQDQQGTL